MKVVISFNSQIRLHFQCSVYAIAFFSVVLASDVVDNLSLNPWGLLLQEIEFCFNKSSSYRAVRRFQILGGHTLSRVQIMTMKLLGTSTKSSKYWVGKCPCAHPVPTALSLKSHTKERKI